MCTYTYALFCAVRGNTGVEKEETPPVIPTDSRSLVTCFSSYSIFTHCAGSLSPSILFIHHALRVHLFSFASLSLSLSSLCFHHLFALFAYLVPSVPIILLISLIHDYSSHIACHTNADIFRYHVIITDELLMIRITCKRKGNNCNREKADINIKPSLILNAHWNYIVLY